MTQSNVYGTAPNNLEAFWMPFTANRQFKSAAAPARRAPRACTTPPSTAARCSTAPPGLWCVNAGHGRPRDRRGGRASRSADLDYAPAVPDGPSAGLRARRRGSSSSRPSGLDHVFFTNSGSESVDTALKIALAYHRARGEGTRTRLIGRERGYHGVGFGGISVGGIVANRKCFGTLLPGVDHLPHTHDLERNAFSRGEPEHGARARRRARAPRRAARRRRPSPP